MINKVPALLKSNNLGSDTNESLIRGLHCRIVDPNDGVRAVACRVLCEISISDLTSVPRDFLEDVGRRMRDKRVWVALTAMEGLVGVFRAWCQRAMMRK